MESSLLCRITSASAWKWGAVLQFRCAWFRSLFWSCSTAFMMLDLCSSSVTCICGPASSVSSSWTTSSWMESLITFKVQHWWWCISSCLHSISLLPRLLAVDEVKSRLALNLNLTVPDWPVAIALIHLHRQILTSRMPLTVKVNVKVYISRDCE